MCTFFNLATISNLMWIVGLKRGSWIALDDHDGRLYLLAIMVFSIFMNVALSHLRDTSRQRGIADAALPLPEDDATDLPYWFIYALHRKPVWCAGNGAFGIGAKWVLLSVSPRLAGRVGRRTECNSSARAVGYIVRSRHSRFIWLWRWDLHIQHGYLQDKLSMVRTEYPFSK